SVEFSAVTKSATFFYFARGDTCVSHTTYTPHFAHFPVGPRITKSTNLKTTASDLLISISTNLHSATLYLRAALRPHMIVCFLRSLNIIYCPFPVLDILPLLFHCSLGLALQINCHHHYILCVS